MKSRVAPAPRRSGRVRQLKDSFLGNQRNILLCRIRCLFAQTRDSTASSKGKVTLIFPLRPVQSVCTRFHVLQPLFFNRQSFDGFSSSEDGLCTAEVHVRLRQISNALVVSLVIVIVDKSVDVRFEITRQVINAPNRMGVLSG